MTSFYNWSVTAASNADADAGFTQAEGMAAAAVNDGARTMMARLAALLDMLGGAATHGGAADAYTIASPAGHEVTAYVDGLLVALIPGADNTGASTLALDGLAAKAVRINTAALSAGDLRQNGKYLLAYSTALGYFQILGVIASGAFQPIDITLTILSAINYAAGKVAVGSGADTITLVDSTAYGRSLWNVANEAALKALVNLETGIDVEAFDADISRNDVANVFTAAQSIVTATPQLTLADGGSNNVAKFAIVRARQYASSAEAEGFAGLGFAGENGANTIYLGGGFSDHNAATELNFITAADAATRTGTVAARVNSASQFLVSAAGAAAPGLAFLTDTDTGVFRQGANQFGVACGGALAAYFTSSGLLNAAGNPYWHAGNDGSGSGADADLLRGVTPGTTGLALLDDASAAAALATLGLASGDTLSIAALELSHATQNTVTGAAGVLYIEGVALPKVGKQAIPVPAAAMTPRTTAGAAQVTSESATHKVMTRTLAFDQTTPEYAQFIVPAMPKSWNESTVSMRAVWTSSGTGTARWAFRAVAISDDDPLDAAFGTAVTVDDTVTAAGDVMKSAESGAITIGGSPAEGDMVVFEAYRDAGDGADTLNADAHLIGIELFITTNAPNDA